MMTSLLRFACYLARQGRSLPGHWRLLRWLEQRSDTIAQLKPATIGYGPYRLQVDPADENGRQVYIHGLNRDDRVVQHIQRLLRPGDVMLDIGANCGYMSFAAAEIVGANGEVIAFEPSPTTGPLLAQNVKLNPRASVEVHHVAVGAQAGTLEFHAVPNRSGYSSLRTAGRPPEELCKVPVIALDDWLERLPTVRLIKLDIEGAELLALRGAWRLIARDRPFLIFEMDDTFLRELGGSAAELCDFLSGVGYTLDRIGAGGSLSTFTQAPTERCNLLATPQPVGEATEPQLRITQVKPKSAPLEQSA